MLTTTEPPGADMAQKGEWHEWRGGVDRHLKTIDLRLDKLEGVVERLTEQMQVLRETVAALVAESRWTRRMMTAVFAMQIGVLGAVLAK